MKRRILIIISVVVIICSFIACTHNSGSENISTTAVDVVTTEITVQGKSTKTQTTSTSAQNQANNVIDFESVTNTTTTATAKPETTVTTTEKTTTKIQSNTTTQKPTQPITDKYGWINKWY